MSSFTSWPVSLRFGTECSVLTDRSCAAVRSQTLTEMVFTRGLAWQLSSSSAQSVCVRAGVSHVLCPFRVKSGSYLQCGLPCTMSCVSVFPWEFCLTAESSNFCGPFSIPSKAQPWQQMLALSLYYYSLKYKCLSYILYNVICFRKGKAQVVLVCSTFIPAVLTSLFLPVLASLPMKDFTWLGSSTAKADFAAHSYSAWLPGLAARSETALSAASVCSSQLHRCKFHMRNKTPAKQRCLWWSNLVLKTNNPHCIRDHNGSFCIIPDIKLNIRICHLQLHTPNVWCRSSWF